MKQKTTTAKSKQTTKEKTKATASKPTGAKVARIQRKPTAWEQALQKCVIAYDANGMIKEHLERYQQANNGERFWAPKDEVIPYTDPMEGISPAPATLQAIERKQDALEQAEEEAGRNYREAEARALKADGELARSKAEAQIEYGSESLDLAKVALYEALLQAGAIELSMRPAVYTFNDTTKESRANKAERAIFAEAQTLTKLVSPYLRRKALEARTIEETRSILATVEPVKQVEKKNPHGLPWKLEQKADGKFYVIWKGVEYKLRIGRWYEAILHIGRTGAKEFEIMEYVPAGTFKNNEFMKANFRSEIVNSQRTKLIRKT
jgi:hypothetical protein